MAQSVSFDVRDEDYDRDICKAAVCGYRILCETGFDEREDWSYQRHG